VISRNKNRDSYPVNPFLIPEQRIKCSPKLLFYICMRFKKIETMSSKMNMNVIMNYGTIYGIVIIAMSLIFYIVGLENDNIAVFFINLFVTIGALYIFMNKYKMEVGAGFISFTTSFRLGILLTFFGGVISAFYNWIFLSFIDPGAIDKAKEKAYESAISNGRSAEQAITELEMAESIMTPIGMTIIALFVFLLLGLIISAIVSAFIKNENPNPFSEEV